MAHKHEIMAKLQAARQSAARIAEAENQKAYPETPHSGQLKIPEFLEEVALPDTDAALEGEVSIQEELPSADQQQTPFTEMELETEPKKGAEKISYTTISVPKQYGQKAKLYATLLKVNMVEFTCGALDTYILQLQEDGKLPRVDL